MITYFKKLFSIKQRSTDQVGNSARSMKDFNFECTPDLPELFGYKSQWFAIRETDVEKVGNFFQLLDMRCSNWESGLSYAYFDGVFISPPVRGWILVISDSFPDATSGKLDNVIRKMAGHFDAVHYYGSHRVVHYYAWAKAVNGHVIRIFGYIGEAFWDEGEVTEEERTLNFRFEDMEQYENDELLWLPGEEDVLAIAGLWSVNPDIEYEDVEPGVGLVGKLNSDVF